MSDELPIPLAARTSAPAASESPLGIAAEHESGTAGSLPVSTQSCALLELPQELWDTVIDHLHDDESALLACRCVCRAWYPSSRYHLSGHIRLEFPIGRTVTNVLDYHKNDANILGQILHRNRVSSLKVEWPRPRRDQPLRFNSPDFSTDVHISLTRAVQALPHLVSLTIFGLCLQYPRRSSGSEKITHFLEAALQMPRLREVTFFGVTLAEYSPIPHAPSGIALAQSLQKLCIRDSAMSDIPSSWLYPLLRQAKDPRTAKTPLRHLDIPISFLTCCIPEHFASYTSLLLDLGSNLHRLGIQLPHVVGASRAERKISAQQEYPVFLEALSRCTNLRTLDLFLHGLEQSDVARAIIKHLVRLPIPLPISKITFAVRLAQVPEGEVGRASHDLRDLDILLCGLSQIRHVTIRPTMADVPAGDDLAWISNSRQCEGVSYLWGEFKKLRERGLLRVEGLTANT